MDIRRSSHISVRVRHTAEIAHSPCVSAWLGGRVKPWMPQPNTRPDTCQASPKGVGASRHDRIRGLRSIRCVYNRSAMSEPAKGTMSQVVQVLQLLALVIGVAGMFTFIGKRDQQLTQVSTDLDKLAGAVNDLAKTQANTALNDAMHSSQLEDIKRRLNDLERKLK
jgi:hypothetical protein